MVFGFGDNEKKRVDELIGEMSAITRTITGPFANAGGSMTEEWALAFLLVTNQIRAGQDPRAFWTRAINDQSLMARMAHFDFGPYGEMRGVFAGANLVAVVRIIMELESIRKRRPDLDGYIGPKSRAISRFMEDVAYNAGMVESQGGTGFERL